MNLRIKELMEEAGLYDFVIESMGINEEMNKFAELLVRECMEVAHPKLTDVGEWAAGMRLVQKRLKQHFGVEE